ncbi:MAG: hypothetical protein U9Q82_14995 [Chloroflexota bacterium]|nr:hypothetical protein [Chloroflexota bacterium]
MKNKKKDLPPLEEKDEKNEIPEIISEEAPPQVVEPKPEPKPKKEDSKARLFFRKVLRWLLGIIIVFGLGFIASIFMLYRPEVQDYQDEVQTLNGKLQTAQEEIAALENEIDRLTPLENENEALIAMQNEFELRIAVLNARIDVANAQLALAEEDTSKAQISLEKTGDALASINKLLPTDQSDIVAAMQQRLELSLSEIKDDPYAAQSDLDVLATNLLQLEDSLFGSP